MSELLKDAAKRGLKQAARWASTGKNLPRLKGLQAWWQRHVGDQNEINALREQYASLIHAPDQRELLASHERKLHSQFGEDGLLLHFFSQTGALNKDFHRVRHRGRHGVQCRESRAARWLGRPAHGWQRFARRPRADVLPPPAWHRAAARPDSQWTARSAL